jgi:ribosomal protein S18 acetylase RimI-like enzyme
MQHYEIRNTNESDLSFINELIDEAVNYTQRNKYPLFPANKKIFEKDLREGRQYKIIIADNIVCIFSICYTDSILWREKENGDAIYLHRVIANQEYKGQQQFQKVLDWSINHAKAKGRKFIRLDTWASNKKIISYYTSFGFALIENFTTPDSNALPATHRNLELALLEIKI